MSQVDISIGDQRHKHDIGITGSSSIFVENLIVMFVQVVLFMVICS